MAITILIGLLIIIIISLYRGIKSKDIAKNADEFFLQGGKLSLKPFIGTMVSTNLSLGNMIFICAIWGYFYGFSGAFWVAICIIFLAIGFLLYRNKFKDYIEDRSNSGTLHEFIAKKFDGTGNTNLLRYASSLATIVCLLLALVLELHLGSKLFSDFLNTNQAVTFVILSVVIGAYTTLGGFRTVVDTDILQMILMFLGLIFGIIFCYSANIGSIHSFKAGDFFSGAGWANSLGIAFLGFGWLLITMDTWQRNSASRSIDTSKTGVLYSGIIMTVMVILFALFGMYVKDAVEPHAISAGLQSKLSGGAFPFNDLFLIEPTIASNFLKFALGLVFLGLIMAAASTADTFFVVASHSFTTDVLSSRSVKSFGDLDKEQLRVFGVIGRITIIVISFVIIGLWLLLSKLNLLSDPINLFFITYSVQFALLPPLLIGVHSKKKKATAAVISLFFGIFITLLIGFYFLPKVQALDTATYLLLRPDQWLALLPIFTSLAGFISYYISKPLIK